MSALCDHERTHLLYSAPADFNSTTASLGFNPGDMAGTRFCVDICLVNDIIVEAEEMFAVNLDADDSAVRVVAGSAAVTIVEDTTDGKVDLCWVLKLDFITILVI